MLLGATPVRGETVQHAKANVDRDLELGQRTGDCSIAVCPPQIQGEVHKRCGSAIKP